MKDKFVVVFVTAPSLEAGEYIAKGLLEQRLIACANLMTPIKSFYTWQGEIKADEEVLMILKTRADLFQSELIPAIQAIHPYEVPEIIALPIVMGANSYLDWITEVTSEQ
jgi:periplasmic divalent cation tolerance protein